MDQEQHVDLSGQQIAQYTIVSLIGSGGMGKVYRAHDRRLRRDVAIKMVGDGRYADEAARHGLIGEARVLSRLNHPHIATIHDFVTHSCRDCIVMELVPGATIKELLADGPLPIAEVLRLGRQLAHGLAAAHAADVVHGDIKPANLKLTSSGELKILDFGSAKLLPGVLVAETLNETPSSGQLVGTVPYMAPEQLRGESIDQISDIFSAGAVLYEMATGRQPFPHKQLGPLVEAILHEDPPALSSVNPFVPPAVERAVAKAMEKRRSDRYQSALKLGCELKTVMLRSTDDADSYESVGWWSQFAR